MYAHRYVHIFRLNALSMYVRTYVYNISKSFASDRRVQRLIGLAAPPWIDNDARRNSTSMHTTLNRLVLHPLHNPDIEYSS